MRRTNKFELFLGTQIDSYFPAGTFGNFLCGVAYGLPLFALKAPYLRFVQLARLQGVYVINLLY